VWLRPGGLLMATMGASDSPDIVEPDWLGVPMFFSHFDADTNREMVRRAGLDVVCSYSLLRMRLQSSQPPVLRNADERRCDRMAHCLHSWDNESWAAITSSCGNLSF
jgi:hypothetical protein